MRRRYTDRHVLAIRIASAVAAVLAIFGVCAVADHYLVKDDTTSTSVTDKVMIPLREGDRVERVVTENYIQFKRPYAVVGGTLVRSGLPTPYIGTSEAGDDAEATVDMLCAVVLKINGESPSDHGDEDTKQLKNACDTARNAQINGKIDDCQNSLLNLGKLLVTRLTDEPTILDHSFTNGNINAACGDEKGRSAALDSGTYNVPVLAVSMGK